MSNEQIERLATLIKGRPQPGKRPSAGDARARVLAAYQIMEFELGMVPTVRELAAKLGVVPSTVQHHLTQLRTAGVVPSAPGERWRRPHVNGRWVKA